MRHTHNMHGSLVPLASHTYLVFNCYLKEILGPTLRGLPLHPDGRCPIFSLYWWGPISIFNIGLRIATQRLTDSRVCVWGPLHAAPFHYHVSMRDVWGQPPSRWLRPGWDTSLPVSSRNLFSKETKWSRCATYVALVSECEQYTDVTFHHSPRDLCTRVKIDGCDSLALELPCVLFKHLNPYAPTTVSSLSFARASF